MSRAVPTAPRLAFITGASSGIGQALALRYAALGWCLALVARREGELGDWVATQGWSADLCRVYGADVSAVDPIVAAGQACIDKQGLPDVVIANAGISEGMDSSERGDLDVMARTFATNNLGMAATFQPFIGPMRVRGSGTLVGIASVAAVRGLPGHAAYCASKAAVVNYGESLRGELRGSGVRVVILAPGWVDTPLTRGNRYPMPFMLSAAAFAERALPVITAGTSYRVIPWQMGVVAKFLRVLPDAWFDRLLAGRPRKSRAPGG